MRYQHLKTIKRWKENLLPFSPLLIVVFFFLFRPTVPQVLVEAVHTIAKPLWDMRESLITSVRDTNNSLLSKEAILERNTYLEKELQHHIREQFALDALKKENEMLQELLGRTHSSVVTIVATILHGDTFSPYDSFVIDQGSLNGIRENMLVVSQEGVALGKVSTLMKNASIVTLFSAPSMQTSAILYASTTLHTTVQGMGAGTMLISLPRDISTTVGDTVTLPTLETYILGTVLSIEEKPESASKLLYIETPLNTHELRHVLVDSTSLWSTLLISTSTETGTQEKEGEEVREVEGDQENIF